MTVLVTGSAGFIGKHVVRALEASGETVYGLDIHAEFGASLFALNDIRQGATLTAVFEHLHPDAVIHLAARVGVRESVTDPAGYVSTNVLGSLHVLEACRLVGVKHVVMASTSSIYGNQNSQFETAQPQPLSPYAASKVGMEALAQTYAHLYGMNISILRLFSVYGEGIRPDLMIYRLMDSLVHNTPVTLFQNGELCRDWTYVGDIIQGVLAALNLRGFEIFNLGSGQSTRLGRLVELLEDISGLTPHILAASAPKTEPKNTRASIDKAGRMLGYIPTMDLENGLRRTWAWYQQSVMGRA